MSDNYPTTHNEASYKLLQLEKDFRYNILLLSERDTLIESYQLTIQKFSVLLIENGIATNEEVDVMLQNISLQPSRSQSNKATQHPDSLQSLTNEQSKDDLKQLDNGRGDFTTQLQQFLNLSQSILTDTIDVNNFCHYKNRQFEVLVQELQSTNSKISHLQDSIKSQPSGDKSESKELVEGEKPLSEQISALQADLSTQKSIFHSFYRSKERSFLDAKERFVDIELRLNSEIEYLQSEVSNLRVESSQSETQYHQQHQDILDKNYKLTKLLFILRDFISNERSVFSHEIASKDQQIAQLRSDAQVIKASLDIKADELLALKREISENHQKHKALTQEKRQVELDLLHSFEEREQVLIAAHQSRLENLHIEHQQFLENIREMNQKLILVGEKSEIFTSEREKCIQLIAQDHGSIDIKEDYLPNIIEEILDQNIKQRETIEEMNSRIESLVSSTMITEPRKVVDRDTPPASRENLGALTYSEVYANIENSEQIKYQLEQKENEVKQLNETIDGLRSVLSQKDSLINSFHQHFSLIKSFSNSTSLSKNTTQDVYNNKIMILVQRSISLMKEKNRLVEANHKLKLENSDLRDKYSQLSTDTNHSQSEQFQFENPYTHSDGSSHSSINKPTAEQARQTKPDTDNILSAVNTDNVLAHMNNSPHTNNSTLLSFNINSECPDWFNDSSFQRALFYADNPEHIDNEFTLSTPKVIAYSSPIP